MGSGTTDRCGARKRGVSRRQVLKTTALGVASATGVGQVYGSVTQSVTQIEDWNDLVAIEDDPSGDYELVTNLNMVSSGFNQRVTGPDGGWSPIGRNSPFTGTFEGNGFIIRRLQNDTQFAGLFGDIDGATIRNLRLLEIDVTGQEGAGGLVSACIDSGEISNVLVQGTVTGNGTAGTGGVVGRTVAADGAESSDLQVTDVAALVDVAGNARVGGLVGRATGDTIETSYARGAVEGETGVGGIVGEGTAGTTLSESYTSTEVNGADIKTTGGLVGITGDVTTDGVYWDGDVAGATIRSQVGTELDTQEMQGEPARENMTAFDFEETWAVQTDPVDYPVLQWEFRTPAIEVANVEVPDGVSPGEEFEVTVVVANGGDGEGSGTVTATFQGETQTQETSALFPLREEQLTFSAVAPEESGSYEYTVSTDAGTATATVSVVGDPAFEITGTTAPETAEPGATIEASATVANTGNGPGEATVAYDLGGADSGETTVELDAGDSETVTFDVTAPEEEGSYDLSVSVDGSTTTASLTVEGAGDDSANNETETTTQDEESADDGGPGFGILSAVAGLGGLGYALRDRLTERESE